MWTYSGGYGGCGATNQHSENSFSLYVPGSARMYVCTVMSVICDVTVFQKKLSDIMFHLPSRC